ncbi:DNA-directed RNA polymerase III subunit RPC3 [Apis mellifera caucasica]|uniref:DNA-directed RNA polymerase III subunit RPC3 n=1 Tax=Apis mellifera TaxID=7460 RepID=A0A7M7GSH7_APIME|nr:DNA-directed RNA polymerase III subunit RPC3 [Apis mellifera]KAG6796980.1 DNA-directed RNA polymerase III subunit RPC3 [Apis mellifera caucasica]KAG9436683.1 DNA-directed RNA polymerase III subunit RPC3 [Apis mellifera carnica]|eukprot:XP_006565404.1 DNA-directed RNA polymerase III subunit RPC3 [Apis mellifera]
MSLICRKLCSFILFEHFGQIVQCVGEDLFKYGAKPLVLIRHTTHLPVTKIKEALCVLIKHGLVKYRQTEKGIEYILIYERVLNILRYPKYMFFVKTNCGNEAEMMLEQVLKNGYITASEVIIKTYKRMEQSPSSIQPSIPVLKEKFELLIKYQFLMRSTNKNEEEGNSKRDFTLPDLDLAAISKYLEGDNCNLKDKIYWEINIDRFTQDFRDQIIVSSISKRLDKNAGELMRRLLFLMYLRTASWEDTSNPIPFAEIKDAVKKLNYPLLTQHLDQYLRLIEEDSSQFLKRVGDSGGGQYSVNMKEAFNQLAWASLENIVMERFGSKAARIFRLVRARKYIEQEQIQQLAMIPAKEAKHLTYTLLQENYLQMQEIKKSGVSAAPIKTFFLFHIDLNLVVRMEIEHCYHALYNIMQRREYEVNSNKRMIDKQLRMQTLTSNLKEHGAPEEQLAEIAEMMTPTEKQQLEKVQNTIKKLGITELQIDDTLFLLTMYLRYH